VGILLHGASYNTSEAKANQILMWHTYLKHIG
jgi:hypothetical protein